MAHKETMSKQAASKAARVLRDPKSAATEKSAAGSALTQRRGKRH